MPSKAPVIIQRAKQMRYALTKEEMRLWWYLQHNKAVFGRFRRQVPIDFYIADFVSFQHRLIVEVDGGQHNTVKDLARDTYLYNQGFRILRFTNLQVFQEIEAVLATIMAAIHPTPKLATQLSTLPQGEG